MTLWYNWAEPGTADTICWQCPSHSFHLQVSRHWPQLCSSVLTLILHTLIYTSGKVLSQTMSKVELFILEKKWILGHQGFESRTNQYCSPHIPQRPRDATCTQFLKGESTSRVVALSEYCVCVFITVSMWKLRNCWVWQLLLQLPTASYYIASKFPSTNTSKEQFGANNTKYKIILFYRSWIPGKVAALW